MTAASTMFPPPDSLGEAEFDFLCKAVYELSRIKLGAEKRALVTARVSKRLRALGLGSYQEYCRLLRSGNAGDELAQLVDVISTNHTLFFREESHFHFLRDTLLPRWQSAHRGETLRVWSAACSSGEEPHTLAIVLAEFFHGTEGWHIDATDISTRILARAEQAVYDENKVTPIRPELLRRYFQRGVGKWEAHYRVKDSLRQQITFRHLNLLQPDYPFSHRFHIIFCRNVMIYFDQPTQETLVTKLSNQLEPEGHLIVGHSESLGNIRHPLRPVQPTIYRRPGS